MALVETIIDNFDTNSFNLSVWDGGSASGDPSQVKNQNMQVEITHTATSQYNTLATTGTYDLTKSYGLVKVVDAGDMTIASHQAVFGMNIDGNNSIFMTALNGTLQCYKKVATVQSQVGSSIAYVPNQHRWWRIREAGGTLFYETSPTGRGTGWQLIQSIANPIAVTALFAYVQSGCFSNESNGSYSYFDNFNYIPGPPVLNRMRPHVFSPGLAR